MLNTLSRILPHPIDDLLIYAIVLVLFCLAFGVLGWLETTTRHKGGN